MIAQLSKVQSQNSIRSQVLKKLSELSALKNTYHPVGPAVLWQRLVPVGDDPLELLGLELDVPRVGGLEIGDSFEIFRRVFNFFVLFRRVAEIAEAEIEREVRHFLLVVEIIRLQILGIVVSLGYHSP